MTSLGRLDAQEIYPVRVTHTYIWRSVSVVRFRGVRVEPSSIHYYIFRNGHSNAWKSFEMVMKMKSKVLGFLLLTLVASAQAFECKVFVDEKDVYSFGSARLGDPRSGIKKKVTKSKECFEDPRKQLYDCEYTDDTGVSYLVNENMIERLNLYPTNFRCGGLARTAPKATDTFWAPTIA